MRNQMTEFNVECYDCNEEVLDALMNYISSNFTNLYLENEYVYYLVAHSFLTKKSRRLEQRIRENDLLYEWYGIEIDETSPKYDDFVKKAVEDALGFYVEESDLIEEFNQLKEYPKEFGDIFDNVEDSLPKSGLKLKQFNEISHIIGQFLVRDQNIQLDDVVDALIDWDIQKSYKLGAVIYTVPEINKLMAKIAATNYYDDSSKIGTLKSNEMPKIGSIYDGFYGLGRSPVAVLKYLNGEVWGQEINPNVYKLSNFNHGVSKTVVNDNSLYNSTFFDKEFDVIVSEPPFNPKGRLNDQEKNLLSVKGINNVNNYSEWIYVLSSLHNLKDDGIMAITLPLGPLSKGTDKQLREDVIVNKNALDAVIVLPQKLAAYTAIPMVVLVFKKNRFTEDNILFIDASDCFEPNLKVNILRDECIDKIVETYVNKEEIDKFSSFVSIDEIRENDFNLAINRYVDTFEGKNINLEDVISKKEELNNQLDEINEKIDNLTLKLAINE